MGKATCVALCLFFFCGQRLCLPSKQKNGGELSISPGGGIFGGSRDGEMMETANTLTFRPLFAYRKAQAQKQRIRAQRRSYRKPSRRYATGWDSYYPKYDYYYPRRPYYSSDYYQNAKFPTIA